MGGRRGPAWARCALAALAALSVCCAEDTQDRASWAGPGNALPAPPATARTLLVLALSASEPTGTVEDFLACTFQAHQPSVANVALDVLVALSGRHPADERREQAVFEMVDRAVSSAMAVQPAFYKVSTRPEGQEDDEVDGDDAVDPPFEAVGLLSFLDDHPGQDYDHAIILDSQVCAVRVGWLDVALAPLLRDPQIVLSGSLVQNDCKHGSKKPSPPCLKKSGPAHQMAGILSLRLSGQRNTLLGHAAEHYRDLPITEAILAAAENRAVAPADAIFTNPRLLALHAPVDEIMFKEAVYYGLEAQIALVHAPPGLRVPGHVALAARLDLPPNQPAIVIVLPPAGVPNLQSLLKSTRTSFVNAGFPGKAIFFLACSRQGLVEASSLASFQVLMTSSASASEADPCSGSAVLETAASLARTGVHSMLLVGLDAAATGSARAALASLKIRGKARPAIYLQPGADPPMQAAHVDGPSGPPLNVGALFVRSPPDKVDRAGAALSAWASALAGDRQLSRASLDALLSHMVDVVTVPDDKFAWAGDWRFLSALDNGDARKSKTGIVYSAGFASMSATGSVFLADWAAATAFRHRALALWNGGPGPICGTHSAASRKPMLLDSMGAVERAVRRVADFMAFARKHRLDCAVFPGFVLGGPGGPVVPVDAVLDGETIRALARPGLVLYPRFADMDANAEGFVPFHPSSREDGLHRQVLRTRHRRHASAAPAPMWPNAVQGGDVPPTWAGSVPGAGHVTASPAQAELAGAAPFTDALSLLSRSLVRAIQDELASLSGGGNLGAAGLVCAHDGRRRTPSETALLAVEGGVVHLAAQLPRLTSGRPLLLTGSAWRPAAGILRAEAEAAGVHAWAPGFRLLTAADFDLAKVGGPGRAGGPSGGGPAWAPVIEYVACQATAATTRLPPLDLRACLPPPLPPASIVSRLATHVPPDILVEDLTAFATWWHRADRPALLTGTWARIVLGDEGGGGDAGDRESAPDAGHLSTSSALPDVGIARAVCANLVFMPGAATQASGGRPHAWSSIIGADALASFYWASPHVLPPSVGYLLDPAGLLDLAHCFGSAAPQRPAPACAGLPFTREAHAESARFLMGQQFVRAVAVLRRASGRVGEGARSYVDASLPGEQLRSMFPCRAAPLVRVLTLTCSRGAC